ncbi:MAG TPA: hypothetical protein VKV32_17880 [Stellaceae bacterium]|nr:hypothetical protein [Stellaceae bacterium]
MTRRFRLPALLLLFFLAACAASPVEQPAAFAPLAPGMARIVFYRDIGYYDPSVDLTVSLNDKAVGVLPRGDAFYRDVPAGMPYAITFTPTRVVPYQFKSVTPRAGEVFYVKLIAMPETVCSSARGGGSGGGCDISGFTSVVVDPAEAQLEMRQLHLVRG